MARSAPPQKPPQPPPGREPGEKYLTLMEHLAELRYRIVVSSFAVVIGLAITAVFAADIIDFLEQPAKDRAPDFQPQFIEPFENFVVYFKVALLGGLVLGMPVIVFQILRFVSPALRGPERIWLWGTVLGATALFLCGVAFAYYVALPPAMDFLLNFNTDLAKPNIRISSYIDFVTRLLFWTGVCFEIPIVVMYLARFRVVRAGQLLRWWRYAIVLIAVIAAIVTPTVDPVTMSLVMAPMVVLYAAGILLAWIVQPRGGKALIGG
ncbi:MAG TPA: twin-arginine translocase subunit TatC [Dehalococcoidia bacterium]|jgi:sec-independent protein translocase protein TatC|nr:twin-arginine translocase subunit TatC [Dehalococcoidia bacterium]